MLHFPVLLEESIDFLVQKVDGNFIDCTYGRGGHSSAILDKLTKNGHLTSFDKDPEAYEHAANISENNFTPIHSSCLLYTSPSPRDRQKSRMPSSA